VSLAVRFLPAARLELRKAVEFYDAQVSGLGDEFAHAVERTIQQAARNPYHGREVLEGNPRLLLDRFPYSVVYRTHADTLVVVAVAHQRRKPIYWQSRF